MVRSSKTRNCVFQGLLATTLMWLIFFFINRKIMTQDYSFSPAALLRSNITKDTGSNQFKNADDDFEDKYFKRVLDTFKGRPWHDVSKKQFRYDDTPTFFLYSVDGLHAKFWVEQMRPLYAGECPFPCRVTEDINMIPKVDAVVLFLKHLKNRKTVEERLLTRDPSQPWIMLSIEAPTFGNDMYYTPYSEFDNFFNRSMTYLKDADVMIYPGFIIDKRDAHFLPYHWRIPPHNISATNSSRMPVKIVSSISNCGATSGRLEYINVLKNYIEVDVYGKCGTLNCGHHLWIEDAYKPDTEPCLKMMGTSYMFYLAFEKAICKNYATEKLYNLLYYPIVPIVLGGIEYDEILPPHSFINAADYTPSELATYVKFLVDNPEEYEKYFEWRQNYVPSTIGGEISICDLCTRLYDPMFYSYNVIKNFSNWFSVDLNCHTMWRRTNVSVY